ncbi:MAG: hypothetical protein ACK551_02340 [Vampirovibrionales bacterium]
MKLFTSTSSNLSQLQRPSYNNARVGSNIFGNYTRPFIPMQEGKPTESMLYLFEEPYPANSNISELLREIPSWMSALFWKGPKGEENVTVSNGVLLPHNSRRHCKDGKVLTHRSRPLYTLIKSEEGDSLKINLPSGVRYSYETGKSSEVRWGRGRRGQQSFAQIDFPENDPHKYYLNVFLGISDTGKAPKHKTYIPPREAHCVSFDARDHEMPVIFFPDPYFGKLVFPKSLNKARKRFGIPDIATFEGLLNHFRRN